MPIQLADRMSSGAARAMLDIIFVLGGIAFFAISVAYTILCNNL